MPPLLEVEGLRAWYGSVAALQNVRLVAEQGSVVALLGPNGAGKTTVMRCVVGLHRAKAGRIRFEGRAIEQYSTAEIVRLGIALVPERSEVFKELTVSENLELGAYVRRDRSLIKRDRDDVFALFPILAERRNTEAGMLSGGQQKMLAIGRALMARPKLLLLDEPSLGLAPVLVSEIFKTIRRIIASGTTLVVVEQNAHMALSIAESGYVLEHGTTVLSDSAKALLSDTRIQRSYLGVL